MKDAAELAAKGAPHGTFVVAEEQTAGMGRHGHSWHSEAGHGLYASGILRLGETSPILTMALGLAVRRAIDDAAGVNTDLRWPNDVMLNERKVSGIMIQSVEGALIAGIGVNVNQPAFPADLRAIATSLRIETGREHSKDALLERVIAEVMRHTLLRRSDVLREFEAHSTYVRGKWVEVDGRVQGITAGLDEHGFLLLRTSGGVETIFAGGVRPL